MRANRVVRWTLNMHREVKPFSSRIAKILNPQFGSANRSWINLWFPFSFSDCCSLKHSFPNCFSSVLYQVEWCWWIFHWIFSDCRWVHRNINSSSENVMEIQEKTIRLDIYFPIHTSRSSHTLITHFYVYCVHLSCLRFASLYVVLKADVDKHFQVWSDYVWIRNRNRKSEAKNIWAQQ